MPKAISENPQPEFSRPVRFDRIAKSGQYTFSETPTEEELRKIAKALDILSVRKMRFSGHLIPLDNDGWLLEATLGASVTQPCVITLEPVRTRIDLEVRRSYVSDTVSSTELAFEDADDIEPLESKIDIGSVALEALSLALPDYPKAEGAKLGELEVVPPGASPIGEETVKPFAGLAALRDKLAKDD